MMSCVYCSGGRISSVVGGGKFQVQDVGDKREPVKIGEYKGLVWDNLEFSKKGYILVKQMVVVKRSQKVIAKYGIQAGVRDDFMIPLKHGLFDNPYWDQLIPFGWLLLEFLKTYAPKDGGLFNYERRRAWQIIKHITGKFPNWFRAQAEHFYGHFLLSDTVKLAKFVKVVKPEQVGHYVGYSWREQLKGHVGLDFDWIDDEVEKIRERLKR